MRSLLFIRIIALPLLLTSTLTVQAQQQKPPHIGFVYPAGGRLGETFEITVGGQFLDEEARVFISGGGIKAKVVACKKPLTPRQLNELRQRVDELQKEPRSPAVVQEIMEIRAKLTAARNLMNPGIAERLTLKVTVDAAAAAEPRELRLETVNGLSNPLAFHVGRLAEFSKKTPPENFEPPGTPMPRRNNEPAPRKTESEMNIALPATVNGQIPPSGVDRYRFSARQGQRLVVAVSARSLVPYLADAVPGWFQAVAALMDSSGKEVAYEDNFRFQPDPVLHCKIPKDGTYMLEIRDSIYRGREDFVYRITIGELPYLTSIFPLGGPPNAQTAVELTGWNLPQNRLSFDSKSLLAKSGRPAKDASLTVLPLAFQKGQLCSNNLPFAVDVLPEGLEKEPNDKLAKAQAVAMPFVVNGRIDWPGDTDVFRVEVPSAGKIVAEVDARRLASPLDSLLTIVDESGLQLAANDDHADKGDGLSTHHADSYLAVDLPVKGVYYLSLSDAQRKGGPEYAYRLRISRPRPNFDLRLVPSTINVRAGGSAPITVHVVRKDGFAGEIQLGLKDAPAGFSLSKGARIPAGQDQVNLTLSAPRAEPEDPVEIALEGRAKIAGREVARQAVPAEDMMQAFFYHHLVPSQDLLVSVIRRVPPRLQLKFLGTSPVKISVGQTAFLEFSGPRGPMLDQIQLALKDPPEGIMLKKFTASREGLTLQIHADAEKAKAGQKGNLLVDAFVERAMNSEKGKPAANRRRFPLGALPAIPFEITPPTP